jgi:hypothetical protein
MRLILAFQCFFLILFGKKLPDTAMPYFPALPAAAPVPETKALPVKAEEAAPAKKKVDAGQQHRDGALALLALLQREGRLVDFLREDLTGHGDDSIGAAARDVHRGCKKVLEQHFGFEPVMPGDEDEPVTVPLGFDPAEIRLVGEARGEPPFQGTLRHHGWRATQVRLPGLADGVDRTVVAPAEVELGAIS